jgi:hypothetical protein
MISYDPDELRKVKLRKRPGKDKHDPRLTVWLFGVPPDPERVYALMVDVIRDVGLPIPKKYRGRTVANVPQTDLEFCVAFVVAQFRKALKELYKRDVEVLLELRTQQIELRRQHMRNKILQEFEDAKRDPRWK